MLQVILLKFVITGLMVQLVYTKMSQIQNHVIVCTIFMMLMEIELEEIQNVTKLAYLKEIITVNLITIDQNF